MDINDNICQGNTLKNIRCKKKKIGDTKFCHLHKVETTRFEKPEECFICYEEIKDDNEYLSCGHWMHRSCFAKTNKDTCPICRNKVKLKKEERKNIRKIKRQEQNEETQLTMFQFYLYMHVLSMSDTDSIEAFVIE